MLGEKQVKQNDMFIYMLDMDQRVREDNPLRKIKEIIDFDFVTPQVKQFYGINGNQSIDPVVIMKMMFLLFYDDVSSERELMRIIPERLDYLWFLNYGLNDHVPNHSVLSKARKRWGAKVFEKLFARVLLQCLQAGLIEGGKIHMDGCLVEADAANNAVVKGSPELIGQLREKLGGVMSKLDDPGEARKYTVRQNKRLVNRTDPDAAMVHQGGQRRHARYKVHRAVDDAHGIITATETTSADVEENSRLMALVDQHEKNTGHKVDTVVADSQYGTNDNFRRCSEKSITSHMGDMLASQKGKGRREGIFSIEEFQYDALTDTYTCPAGQKLIRRKHKKKRQAYEYGCRAAICRDCAFKDRCTSASARTLKRHYHQEAIDAGRKESHSLQAKRDRLKRKWLMEGSFADGANNHGLKRSRWRRLWRQQIQNLLIAAVQNIRKLLKHLGRRNTSAPAAADMAFSRVSGNMNTAAMPLWTASRAQRKAFMLLCMIFGTRMSLRV